ncbi:MAG: TolC family protein [Opitutales bacterium]|nr:TolC family protein [Opitutales bacterium]
MKFVAYLLVFLASVALVAGAELPLRSALLQAIERNLGLDIQRLEPLIAEESVREAEAAFGINLFSSASMTEREQPIVSDVTVGTQTEQRNFRVGAESRNTLGGLVTVETRLDERDTNAAAAISTRNAEFALSYRQPLWRGFGREVNLATLRGARLGSEAEQKRFRRAILDVMRTTEVAYWEYSFQKANRELRESSVQLAEALLEETEERRRLGLATRLDVLQAQAGLAQRREGMISAQQELEIAQDRLLALLGALDLSSPFSEAVSVSPLPDAFGAPPEFAPVWNRVLAENPETDIQEAVIAQRQQDRIVARDRVRPQVDLALSGGVLGADIDDRWQAYDGALNKDGHFWRIGVEVNMPWGFRAERAGVRRSERRLEQAELRLVEIQQDLLEQSRRQWRRLRASHERLEAASLTLELQEETFEQERSRYEAGLSPFRAVQESQRDLDAARLSRLQAVIDLLRAEADLARIDGSILQRHGFTWEQIDLPPRPRN